MSKKKFVKFKDVKIGDKGKDFVGDKGTIVAKFKNYKEFKKTDKTLEYDAILHDEMKDLLLGQDQNYPLVVVKLKSYSGLFLYLYRKKYRFYFKVKK